MVLVKLPKFAFRKRSSLPVAPQAPTEPSYRALYNFTGQSSAELNIKKNEVVLIIEKGPDGWWWLARRQDNSTSGWIPSAYVKEEATQAPLGRLKSRLIKQDSTCSLELDKECSLELDMECSLELDKECSPELDKEYSLELDKEMGNQEILINSK